MTDHPDLETRPLPDGHDDLRVWLRIMTCFNLVQTEMRTRLRERFDITLPRFDLLAQLERVPDGLKMGELSRRMMVTNGNITGITQQLEKEGLISRSNAASDRRVSVLRLTPQGRKAFAVMAREHEAWIKRLFSDLSDQDRETLYRGLSLLKVSVRRNRVAPDQ
ncbi:Transcriptional regulator, MarR family [plant metagenome]|uniref:Transcriptional regulator, MarR family n=2 Tax=root TaxID=1 RepID=A0A1C3K473_9BURK|nr:MarR family transcriptional regulator [Orrella dioscoreae]SBT26306.1 Transcriptional regulator, MarR family [Orrella dioscoreae]SOE47104.1 Transcriptional regulator, MarR family [Orrella dioscoreae]